MGHRNSLDSSHTDTPANAAGEVGADRPELAGRAHARSLHLPVVAAAVAVLVAVTLGGTLALTRPTRATAQPGASALSPKTPTSRPPATTPAKPAGRSSTTVPETRTSRPSATTPTTVATSKTSGTAKAPGATGAATALGTAPACAGSAISVSGTLDSWPSPQGYEGIFELTNRGSTPCTMRGYPGFTILAAGHLQDDPVVDDGSASLHPPVPVTTVTLAPSGAAMFYAIHLNYLLGICPRPAARSTYSVVVSPPGGGAAFPPLSDFRFTPCPGQRVFISPVFPAVPIPRLGGWALGQLPS